MWKAIRNWSMEFTSPFAEAVKEAFRVTLFSIPGELIIYLEDKPFVWKAVIINFVLIFLRALDKYLYERGKQTGYPRDEKPTGLSPI
ncbi:MAG: hypothetical protein M1445_08470 [Bacteroidetes bacterium]|nr:hypothetical protein [Bacteroidota bacterium]